MIGVQPSGLADLIKESISHQTTHHAFVTRYRVPIIGFLAADDPSFAQLSQWTQFDHQVPNELLRPFW